MGALCTHEHLSASHSLRRGGTSDETALLVAEFALLDEGLAVLRVAIDGGQAAMIGEQELDHLASEIPDMRSRLGIRCEACLICPENLGTGLPVWGEGAEILCTSSSNRT